MRKVLWIQIAKYTRKIRWIWCIPKTIFDSKFLSCQQELLNKIYELITKDLTQGSNEVGEQKIDEYYEKSESQEPKNYASIKKFNLEGFKSGYADLYNQNSSENAKIKEPRFIASLNAEAKSYNLEKLTQYVGNFKFRSPKSVQDEGQLQRESKSKENSELYIQKPEDKREKSTLQHQNYDFLKPGLNHTPKNISNEIQKKAMKNSQRKVIYMKI